MEKISEGKKAALASPLTAKDNIMKNTTMKQILYSKITWNTLLDLSKLLEVNDKIIQLRNINYIFWEYY